MAVTFIQTSTVFARESLTNEQDYFNFRKYKSTYTYFDNYQYNDLRDESSAVRKVQRLGKHLVTGFDLLKKNKPDEALVEFKKSSRLVPEYLHVDFIIALTYDKKGEKHKAAKYYKSYLEKLEKFWDGLYRLTSPIIIKTVKFDITGYKRAKELITQRMAASGIDIDKVYSGRNPIVYVIVFIVIMFCVTVYLIIESKPIRRIRYMIKAIFNSRKDTWVCRNCGTLNVNVNIECRECSETRKVTGKAL